MALVTILIHLDLNHHLNHDQRPAAIRAAHREKRRRNFTARRCAALARGFQRPHRGHPDAHRARQRSLRDRRLRRRLPDAAHRARQQGDRGLRKQDHQEPPRRHRPRRRSPLRSPRKGARRLNYKTLNISVFFMMCIWHLFI